MIVSWWVVAAHNHRLPPIVKIILGDSTAKSLRVLPYNLSEVASVMLITWSIEIVTRVSNLVVPFYCSLSRCGCIIVLLMGMPGFVQVFAILTVVVLEKTSIKQILGIIKRLFS